MRRRKEGRREGIESTEFNEANMRMKVKMKAKMMTTTITAAMMAAMATATKTATMATRREGRRREEFTYLPTNRPTLESNR